MNDTGVPPSRGVAARRSHRTAWLLGIGLMACAAAVAWWLFGRKPAAAAAPTKPLVQVTAVTRRAMPVVLQSVGKVVAQASVEIRPQTGGVLRRVFIHDGDRVVAGQKLFELETQPLAASLAQARAQFVRDKSLADDARDAAARLKPLADKEYVTAREYEAALNIQRSLEAAAAATRTLIDQARIALTYATVSAPISGRAGAVLVKPGTLVTANNPTALVVINAIRPVEVAFALPQESLHRLQDAMSDLPPGARLEVEARDSLTQKMRARGELVFVDNALNDVAGTIGLKARFSNADEALWPGEFYAVRITLKVDADAVVLPESALQPGQGGAFVYVVEGGTAKVRRVQTDRVVDGRVVVTSGLSGGETVVTAVPTDLRDGSRVQTEPAATAAPAAATASGAP
ncbi:efflux RND transporter periplasmic adaptor subunit [Paracidovorax anthurii]|uniref:Multidrug efflux system membrane fusion protein n=1 Tax=Paracidovorax anthurii TaxID=78229 RepID=A0A328YW14_9BURK|nr:efflux RND transporter periplasmic adaptor subunit [Paracidovorax anthurii]RAR78000.1 multidrug efflux system membrane fusion protein [Paracidovorax anthurii]